MDCETDVHKNIVLETNEECRAKILERFELIKQQLLDNPQTYELHVKLIGITKELGDFEQLRLARRQMHSVYPLSPALWLDWIKDELKVAVSPAEKRQVEELFNQAIEDYEDINIWLEYCHFAIGNVDFNSLESIKKTESVFENALSHQGLHVASGSLLWETYREFQYVLLSQAERTQNSTLEQIKKIDHIFRRQLCIPLLNMEQTFVEYDQFLSELGNDLYVLNADSQSRIPADLRNDYTTALNRLKILLPFEENLELASEKSEQDSYAAWDAYLNFAVQSRKQKHDKATTSSSEFSPNDVCCLFERAITAHCLNPNIWLQFAEYLEFNLSSDVQRLIRLLARSIRNCPWSVDLWQRYALIVEQSLSQADSNGNGQLSDRAAEDEAARLEFADMKLFEPVETIYETALLAGFENPTDLLRIWMSYCDHQLRRLCALKNDLTPFKHRLSLLRDTFDRALDFCFEALSVHSDLDWSIVENYAFIEAKYAEDLKRARSIWTQLMKLPGHGSQSKFWLGYMQFEKNFGDMKHLLRVCNMAINSVGADQCELLFQTALQCLRQTGVPVTRLREIEQRIHTQQIKLRERCELQSVDNLKTKKSRSKNEVHPVRLLTKRMRKSNKDDHQIVAKKPRSEEPLNASNIRSNPANPTVHGSFVSHDPTKNNVTVFVSNLDFSVREDDLDNTFKNCGNIVSVRLVRDYAGRSKGFAYIEFSNEGDVSRALEMDRHFVQLMGSSAPSSDIPVDTTELTDNASNTPQSARRPMFVSRCDPEKDRPSGFRFAAGKEEPEKLFVRNINKTVTKEDLKKLFCEYGTLVDIRLATYRNGSPKGHAYIEFKTADDASRALVHTDNIEFHGRKLSVAISNPPVRGSEGSHLNTHSLKTDSTVFAIPTHQTSRERPRTHSRTKLELLPRALCLPSLKSFDNRSVENDPATHNESISPITIAAPGSKTNEDFRKLLL